MIASGSAKSCSWPTRASIRRCSCAIPDWSAVFDMDADAARATRRRLLDMVAAERNQLHFYHAPFPATGFVAKAGAISSGCGALEFGGLSARPVPSAAKRSGRCAGLRGRSVGLAASPAMTALAQ